MKSIHSMLLLAVLFAFTVFNYSCSEEEPAPTTTNDTIVPTNPQVFFEYLALGDSYTIGESVEVNSRYPEQLADSLAARGLPYFDVTIVAQTGWTTDELEEGINQTSGLRTNYSLVSLLIGVNNQFRGRDVATYKPDFESLLNQAIAFAGGDRNKVIVISIPDYAYTPFGGGDPSISEGIDIYNAANKTIAAQYGIKYFDITPISRMGLDNTDLVAADGLHPSGLQYTKWVELMINEVEQLFR